MSRNFEELIGAPDDLGDAERARLHRVHELLLEVGPPPEVPARLRAPIPAERRRPRRLVPAFAAAAAAAAVFGAGYLVGAREDADVVRAIAMEGVGVTRDATAVIDLLPEDGAGNWPMEMRISGLPANAEGGDWYELWLTKDGKPIASCGRFTVGAGETTVQLSVPYRLRGYDGWIVTRRGSSTALLST